MAAKVSDSPAHDPARYKPFEGHAKSKRKGKGGETEAAGARESAPGAETEGNSAADGEGKSARESEHAASA